MVFVFQPTTETHNLKEKTVIVTGGSAGVGRVSCKVFASLGAHFIIASRNKEKTCKVIDEIKALTGNETMWRRSKGNFQFYHRIILQE